MHRAEHLRGVVAKITTLKVLFWARLLENELTLT